MRPTEITEPKIGIKFMIKARKPQTIGKSRPIISETIPHNIPVVREIKNFIEMYLIVWLII